MVLQALGELEEAKGHYERALVIGRRVYGEDHPKVALRLNNLGSVLKALGELEEAKGHFERALRIFRERLGDGHPNTQIFRQNLEALLEEMK